jgi:hypothetical protein
MRARPDTAVHPICKIEYGRKEEAPFFGSSLFRVGNGMTRVHSTLEV